MNSEFSFWLCPLYSEHVLFQLTIPHPKLHLKVLLSIWLLCFSCVLLIGFSLILFPPYVSKEKLHQDHYLQLYLLHSYCVHYRSQTLSALHLFLSIHTHWVLLNLHLLIYRLSSNEQWRPKSVSYGYVDTFWDMKVQDTTNTGARTYGKWKNETPNQFPKAGYGQLLIGVNKTLDKVRQQCYWLHMRNNNKSWCQKCDTHTPHWGPQTWSQGLMHQQYDRALFKRIHSDNEGLLWLPSQLYMIPERRPSPSTLPTLDHSHLSYMHPGKVLTRWSPGSMMQSIWSSVIHEWRRWWCTWTD